MVTYTCYIHLIHLSNYTAATRFWWCKIALFVKLFAYVCICVHKHDLQLGQVFFLSTSAKMHRHTCEHVCMWTGPKSFSIFDPIFLSQDYSIIYISRARMTLNDFEDYKSTDRCIWGKLNWTFNAVNTLPSDLLHTFNNAKFNMIQITFFGGWCALSVKARH